jgi:hypothetical protein
MFEDWRDKYLVYVEASSMKSAYNKLDQAGYADYKYTERPSAYSHLDNDELR